MFNKAYCIGGLQHGVKVSIMGRYFLTPDNELYELCTIKTQISYWKFEDRNYWKFYKISFQDAEVLANARWKH